MAGQLAKAVLLSSVWCFGGTVLVSDGKTLFSADGQVTFGATYADHAVRATVMSPAPVAVTIHTGRKPANVFLAGTRLNVDAWSYDADAGTVALRLAGGTSDLQIRFDDVLSLAPFTTSVPVLMAPMAGGTLQEMGQIPVAVADEKAHGTMAWSGPAGVYRLQAWRGNEALPGTIATVQGRQATEEVLLDADAVLRLAADAPGQKLAVDRVVCSQVRQITATRRVPREHLLPAGSILVEGEAFSAEGGGTAKISTEHGNTHGGACVFSWADPGHWIAWDVEVTAEGLYTVAFVIASQEQTVLRSFDLDGQPAPGAAMLSFTGTGGWGRTNAAEWQACQPVDAAGNPVRFHLAAGKRTLRMTNLMGQHLNVDFLVLSPAANE